MFGGSHKLARGGGRGGAAAAKRNSFPPPPAPPHRLSSSTPSGGRLSLGGGPARGRNPSSSSAAAEEPAAADETFSLVGGEPLSFAAIIRLAPDLVEEIKRVEVQGGAARIKFDHNPNNSLGNIIDVGGKTFRFTWSHETVGLCDIYEERRSGEDGNGLLVESGCAWRKLNVQRVLDESTKNHVKMRSEEVERKRKSNKAIVLEQCNPTMKSQMKALAAAEASPWKFKHKKVMHFKKRNIESSQVSAPPKNVNKSGSSSTSTARGRHSASPRPSPPHQSVSLVSPSMKGNVTESQTVTEDTPPIQTRMKENKVSPENDFTARAAGRIEAAAPLRDNKVAGTMELQKLLVTLLKENPKGMSLKALEKAVGDINPSSARKFDPILKKIATYAPPGKYILKPGVDLESFKPSDSGSSPEDNHQKQHVPVGNHGPAPDLGFVRESPADDLEEQASMNNKFVEEPNLVGKNDTAQHISNLFGDDDPPHNSGGQAATSSDSDSDSGSSGRSSYSRSQSRSRSPAGTASGSGSDSENDSSSNSKEGSDVDIDILNDDDKEPKKFQDADHGLSTKPVPWGMPEARSVRDGSAGDQDGYVSEDIDIEEEFLDDNEAEQASAPSEKLKTVSPDHDQCQFYGVTDVRDEQEDVHGEFKHEHPDGLVKSKGKSKRGSDVVQFEGNAEHVKKFKAGSMAPPSMSGYAGSSPLKSPDVTNDDRRDNHTSQMQNKFRDDNPNLGMQRGYNHPLVGKSAANLLQSGQRPAHIHDKETADKFVSNPQDWREDTKYLEETSHGHEGFLRQGDKGHKVILHEEGSLNKNVNGIGKFKEGGLDQKELGGPERHHKKRSEEGKKFNTMENSSRLQMGSSPKDRADINRSPVDSRRLQRESSDLELGELREPLLEEPELTRKHFERVGSFKQSDTKSSTSGSRGADLKGRAGGRPIVDLGKPSSPNLRAGIPKNSDSWAKRSPDPHAEDTIRPSNWSVQSQQQQSRVARAEVGSLSNKAMDLSGSKQGVADQGTDVEGYGETQKKLNRGTQLEDSRQDLGPRKVKGNKSQKSNTLADGMDRQRETSLIESHYDKRKRSESSSDENSSYSKYEKEEPELKGHIKSFSQYKEYVQEYNEKYESYCSLNKILESYRNDFQKLGMDLDSAKGRDMERYYDILALLRESYRQCGMRHKRLKKIFVVLHKELKHLKQRIKDFAVEYMRD